MKMENQLNIPYVNGIIAAALLTGLTACGGTTTQPTTATETPDLVAAPALGSATDNGSPASEPNPAVPNPPSENPVVTTPEVTTPTVTTIVPPDTDTPTADSGVVDTGITDQMLIGAASTVVCDADAAEFNPTMLALINASRVEARMCGSNLRAPVPTLQWNDKLAVAATMHGNDMASNNFFDHTGSDGLGVGDRATAATYNWRAVGENIAAGQLDQAEVHQGWLDSEGHCINIMNQLFTEVGAACINNSSSDFGNYWVVVFGDSK